MAAAVYARILSHWGARFNASWSGGDALEDIQLSFPRTLHTLSFTLANVTSKLLKLLASN